MIVYLAHNLINHKNYVGQTTQSLPKRRKAHIYANNNSLIHKSIKKYGKENFEWIILKNCDSKEEMDLWEQIYIKFLSATNRQFGYNISIGGGVSWNLGKHYKLYNDEQKEYFRRLSTGRIVSPETREKIRLSKLGVKRDPVLMKSIFAKRRSYAGDKNPFYKKQHSKETKKILAQKTKDKGRTVSSIEKQRITLQNQFRENPNKFQQLYNAAIRPKSEETKKKMSEARKKYWDKKKAANG